MAKEKDNTLLAEAFGDKLKISDISDQLKNVQTTSDSSFIINQNTDQWVSDKILFQEAKSKVGKNKDINRLVEEYKKSLIILEWEKIIIKSKLDTVILSSEIDTFYKQRKKDFILQDDIVRFLFFKIPEAEYNDTLKDLWKTEAIPIMKKFINDAKGFHVLHPNNWYYKSEVKNLLPAALYKKIAFRKLESYSLTENETKFFVKILEKADSGDDAPVSFVEETIRERILHDRAHDLLKETKNELYNKNVQNKVIQFYTKADKQ